MICIYGDSILKSVVYENGAYHADPAFARDMAAACRTEVVNRSYFGSTSGKGAARMARDIEAGKPFGELCIVEFGGNDCTYDWSAVNDAPEAAHRPVAEPEVFAGNLRSMIRMVRAQGAIPLLTNMTPIVPDRYFAWITRKLPSGDPIRRWIRHFDRFYQQNEYYSLLCAVIAREEQTLYVDIRAPLLCGNESAALLCEDGMHPNREGHARIWEALRKNCQREVNGQ